jgi:hypothetical protein
VVPRSGPDRLPGEGRRRGLVRVARPRAFLSLRLSNGRGRAVLVEGVEEPHRATDALRAT